jgi:AraC family transcriptional regulator, ethanolamine operon transcriptional activator
MPEPKLKLVRQTFADAADQENALVGWMQHYTQIKPGKFRGAVSSLNLPGVSIIREQMNVAVEQETTSPSGTLLFVSSLTSRSGWRVNSARQPIGTITLTKGGTDLLAVCEKDSDILIVLIDADRITPDLADLPVMQAMPSCPETEATYDWLASLLSAYGHGAMSPELETLLPDLITDRMATIFAKFQRNRAAQLAGNGFDIFRRAQRLFKAEEHEPMTVAALARRLDLTQDVIREAFVDTVGISPSVWLRQQRLDGARRELLRSDNAVRTVSEVAMQWGFWHLGRFSAYYAALYGETPSQTMRR